tara:strand:+ start:556 stop:720 length:165 start_codon:yes stop_codon:yes gene_type:complete
VAVVNVRQEQMEVVGLEAGQRVYQEVLLRQERLIQVVVRGVQRLEQIELMAVQA